MNSKFIASAVVAIAALGSASAFAQSQNYLHGEAVQVPVASTSNVTRAEVKAEYLQARQAGALPVSPEVSFVAAPAAATNLTRAAVREEARHYVFLDGRSQKTYR